MARANGGQNEQVGQFQHKFEARQPHSALSGKQVGLLYSVADDGADVEKDERGKEQLPDSMQGRVGVTPTNWKD